jgi:hypothetical protein
MPGDFSSLTTDVWVSHSSRSDELDIGTYQFLEPSDFDLSFFIEQVKPVAAPLPLFW